MAITPGDTYSAVPDDALALVQPLGVAAVLVTRAPVASGYEPVHQTMVMLEFDATVVPQSEDTLVRQNSTEAIKRLQLHGVVPNGPSDLVACEFGTSMIEHFQAEIDTL